MSLKFNDAIEMVAEKLLEASKPNYQIYLEDAAEISQKMDQELININSIFKGTVVNWDETAHLLTTEIPKLGIPVLRLKMPFMVDPVFVPCMFGGQPTNLKTSVNHPAVENGYLNGDKLTKLFIWDLNRVIDRIQKVTCRSGKTYKVITEFKEKTVGLVIIISCQENDLQTFPTIRYEFSLVFQFTNKSFGWAYFSNLFHQFEESAFFAIIKNKAKVLQRVLLLLQHLVPKALNVSELTALTVINIEAVGSALLELIPIFIPHLQNPGPLISAYGKLLQFKRSDSVQLTEIMNIFGLE